MRRLSMVSLILAVSLAALPATAQNWTQVGPPGGSVRALAADPRDPRHVYLGTADGLLFRSDDSGLSWRLLRPGFPHRGYSLDQIAVDRRGVVLVGYWKVQGAGGGVARSVDGGRTFAVQKDIEGESVRALAVAPADPEVIAAGTLSGVFASHDGGKNWARVTPQANPDLRNVESLVFDPDDPRILYAGTWHLGWKTLDGGATWAPVHDGMIDDSDVMSLTVDRTNPRTVYATACTGIYLSSDGAAHWSKAPGIPEASRRTLAFAQSASDPRLLLAGTTKGLWMSEDAGATWRPASPDRPGVRAVLVEPDGAILLGTEGAGVLRSTDRGATWEPSNDGFSDRFVSRVLFDPDRRRMFAMASDDNGVFVQLGSGGAWARLDEGLEGHSVLALARLGGTMYVGTENGVFARAPDAEAWTRVPMSIDGHDVHARITDLLAVSSRRLLAATPNGVLVSGNAGASWSQPDLGRGGSVLGLAYLPDAPGVVVAATTTGVYRSRDGGSSWRLVSSGLADVTPHALAVVKAQRGVILATTTGGLFRSADLGATWQRVAGGLPQSDLSGLAVDPDGRTVYASDFVRGGIYRSADAGATWARMPAGDLPSERVWTLAIDPESPDRLLASTASGLYALNPASIAVGDADSP